MTPFNLNKYLKINRYRNISAVLMLIFGAATVLMAIFLGEARFLLIISSLATFFFELMFVLLVVFAHMEPCLEGSIYLLSIERREKKLKELSKPSKMLGALGLNQSIINEKNHLISECTDYRAHITTCNHPDCIKARIGINELDKNIADLKREQKISKGIGTTLNIASSLIRGF